LLRPRVFGKLRMERGRAAKSVLRFSRIARTGSTALGIQAVSRPPASHLHTSDPEDNLIMGKSRGEHTSSKVATKASKLLSNPRTPKAVRSVAASALTQVRNKPGRKK
jgi:hypothetical protein